MTDPELLDRFAAIVGQSNALTTNDDLTRYTHENRRMVIGRTPMVLRPASTGEVAAIVRLAAQTGTALVPQGGHTGHAGGGVPDESGTQIVVSLERMNRIREIDVTGNTVIAEAGVLLQSLHDAAGAHDRLFPISLSSQGSCMIGGNIATNAGGTQVLAYGNTREQVLGLEVVLASGEVWNGLRRLKKDNTGYAMKQVFIGSEGTLGIITAAALRLLPMPRGRQAAWIAVPSPAHALDLLNRALDRAGQALTGFELMERTPLEFVLKHVPGSRDPLPNPARWQVLAEISSGSSEGEARRLMEDLLEEGLEQGLVSDAVLADSLAQRDLLWKLRDSMGPAQIPEGLSIKHDISVPVHRLPDFMEMAERAVMAVMPEARLCVFGHMGDGNLHYNVSQPVGMAAQFEAKRAAISEAVHALVMAMEGSISAEHGIGRLKRDLLHATASPVEIAMMRALKQALDPDGILNPGKIV